jgi:hypothetical protein
MRGEEMSLDLWLEMDTGGPCPAVVGDNNLNYTHNVNPMWRELFGMSLGKYVENMQAQLVEEELKHAWVVMANDPGRFAPLNPPNGWGDYDSALRFLGRVIENGRLHPLATWRASF